MNMGNSFKTRKKSAMDKALPGLAQRLANAIRAKISVALADSKRRAVS